MRRLATLVTASALAVGVLPLLAVPASAATTSLFTMDLALVGQGPSVVTSTAATATASTNPPQGLRMTGTDNRSLILAPPTGQVFTVGTSYPVGGARTDTIGSVSVPSGCSGQTGTVSVQAVTFDGAGVLSSLAASYDTTCTNNAGSYVSGVVRFNNASAYAHATATATAVQAGVGQATSVPVTVTNAGPAPSTPSSPSLSGAAAADWSVGSDACVGVALTAGQSCTVTLSVTPSVEGDRSALLSVPMSGNPRGLGAIARLAATGVAPPPAVTGLRQYAALGGLGVTWSRPSLGAVTGYRVYRDATEVADVPQAVSSYAPLTALDTGVGSGAGGSYTVVAYGPGGQAPASPALAATRPATDPSVGTADAIALDGLNRHVAVDTARGDAVELGNGLSSGSLVRATLPVVPGPGTYTLSANPTGDERRLDLTLESLGCQGVTGTLVVTDAAFDAALVPTLYSAELDAQCAGSPVTGSLRWHSTRTYSAAAVAPTQIATSTTVGTSRDQTVTVTNKGTVPLTVGTPALTGTGASAWSVAAGGCSSSVAVSGRCELTLTLTPAERGAHDATLTVPLSTGDGSRTVTLAGVGGTVPGPVGTPYLTRGLRRTLVQWTFPEDGGEAGFVGYQVARALADGDFGAPVSTTDPSYLDTDVVPGTSYRYRVAAVTEAGVGPTVVTAPTVGAWSTVVAADYVAGIPSLVMVSSAEGGRTVPFLVGGPARTSPAVSPDGRRVAYAQANPNGETDLWVAPVDGSTAPVRLTTLTGSETDPAWSPTGTTLAFSRITGVDTFARAVWTVPAAGGTAALRANLMSHPTWLPDSQRLIAEQDHTAKLYVVAANGAATALAGSDHGYEPEVSPDGTRVLYVRDDGSNPAVLAVLPVTGGAPVLQTSTRSHADPTWSPDGTTVYADQLNSTPVLTAYPWTGDGFGSTPEYLLNTFSVFHRADAATEGVALTSAPAGLTNATTASVGWTAPPGTTVTCSVDGAAAQDCASPLALSGLAVGAHRVVLTATGASASITAASWVVDRTLPVAVMTSPAAHGAVLTTSVTVAYRATDASGVASYDVRYRRATSNANYGAYTSPAGWVATTAGTRALGVVPGGEYCFSVRARDRAGNVSAWTADRCVAVAVDDRALTASAGWTRMSASGAYKGTVTSTTRAGTTLGLRAVQTRRVTLYVTKCAACGPVAVWVGSTRIAVVDTRASTTLRAVKVVLSLQPVMRTGALSLRPTTAGRTVQVDGIAFGRS